MSDSITCSHHPSEPAGWTCAACDAVLCPACASAHQTLRGVLLRCATCGGLVEPILVTPSSILPFTELWLDALWPVLTPLGLAMAAVSAVSAEYLQRLSARTWPVGWVLELGWFLTVLRRGGRGYPPFGPPTWGDLATLLPGPMARLGLALFPLVLGACALGRFGEVQLAAGTTLFWLLGAGAVWLLPSAVLLATVEGEGQRWLFPWQLPTAAKPYAADLWPLRGVSLVFVACVMAQGLLPRLVLNDTKMADKIVLAAGVHFLASLALAGLACLTGVLLRTHAHALGHGEPDRRFVPVLGDALPTGTYREKPAPPPPELGPIELEDPRDGLLAALARGDSEDAVHRYRSGDVPLDKLDGPVHVQVAKLLVARGELEAGANALRGLLWRTPQSPVAAQAMVLLGRLLSERLGSDAEARDLFAQVVARFPQSEAARFAQSRLAGGMR